MVDWSHREAVYSSQSRSNTKDETLDVSVRSSATMRAKTMSGIRADFLIVGAGCAGATFARCASDAGYTALVIDRRAHVGGNSYSSRDDESGVEVHRYGSHIFHTSSKDTWDFVRRFSDFNTYRHTVKARTNGGVFGMPIDLHTINQFFGRAFSPMEAMAFIQTKTAKLESVSNFEECVLASVGRELYEAFYLNYTIKHWGRHPTLIPVSTAKRLPVRYHYADNYFDDRFQGIPKDGYGALFERVLNHQNIRVAVAESFDTYRTNWRQHFRYLVYTGPIDEYFGCVAGRLPYRTVWFKEHRGTDLLGTAVVNYCDSSTPSTRIHEYKWYTPEKPCSSSIAFEEFAADASPGDDAYYPVHEPGADAILQRYQDLARYEPDVLFLGRLAEFRYYDMHQAVAAAMSRFKSFSEGLRQTGSGR